MSTFFQISQVVAAPTITVYSAVMFLLYICIVLHTYCIIIIIHNYNNNNYYYYIILYNYILYNYIHAALSFLLLCCIKLCCMKDSESEESDVKENAEPTDKERIDGKIAPNSIPHIRILDNTTTLTHQMNTGKYCRYRCSTLR